MSVGRLQVGPSLYVSMFDEEYILDEAGKHISASVPLSFAGLQGLFK